MIYRQPKPDWASLPRPDCVNVEFRVLLEIDGIMLANLRFSGNATIEHDAPHDIDVVCISGSGFTSIGSETFSISAGETVQWPRNTDHRLWTDSSRMKTLMVERYDA